MQPPDSSGVSSDAGNDKVKGNLNRFHCESAASAVEDAALNYQSPSMIAVGADAQSISILSLVVNLVLAVVCYKAPALIERIGLTKNGAIVLALINTFIWLPLIVSFVFLSTIMPPFWYILIWLINLMPALLLSTQRDNWLSSLIPRNIMGRYLGQRMAIRNAFYLGAFCMAGYLLDSLKDNELSGFTVIFVVAFLAAFVNLLVYWSMKDCRADPLEPKEEKQEELGFLDFLRDIKERKLNIFILFTSVFGITVSICGPLYAFYMLKELHFSYLNFTMVISAEYLARITSAPFWGRYADRAGNIKVLSLASRVIPFVPICWLFGSHLIYLIIIQIISGICWGAYDLSTQNYLFKMAPAAKKLRYIVYSRSLSMFCVVAGGLLSVYFLNEIIPIAGSRILAIFLVSGIFRGLVVLFLVPKLIDFALFYGHPGKSTVIDEAILKQALASRSGLYYHSDLWDKYLQKVQPHQAAGFKEIPVLESSLSALYHHPERWAKYREYNLKKTSGNMHHVSMFFQTNSSNNNRLKRLYPQSAF